MSAQEKSEVLVRVEDTGWGKRNLLTSSSHDLIDLSQCDSLVAHRFVPFFARRFAGFFRRAAWIFGLGVHS